MSIRVGNGSPWLCLVCGWRGSWEELKKPDYARCPKCTSVRIHPQDGDTVEAGASPHACASKHLH